MMAATWKNEIADIRHLARLVSDVSTDQQMSARGAACCMYGAVCLVAERHGVDAMQRSCADIVRCDAAWSSNFGTLPRAMDGTVPETIRIIAILARGVIPLAGADRTRAALAFWAAEDDPAVWQRVTAAPCVALRGLTTRGT
jgi:hypothetical protein